MRSFYEYVLTLRGKLHTDSTSQLADWIFYDHDFPKHSGDYNEISDYLEWNAPFNGALDTFDQIWNQYMDTYMNRQ